MNSRNCVRSLVGSASFAWFASIACGQSPVLVRDVNQTAASSAVPVLAGAIALPDRLVFDVGSRPWTTNGTDAMPLLDTILSRIDSTSWARAGDVGLFFAAPTSQTAANRLWRTDGTRAGTYPIKVVPMAADPFGLTLITGSVAQGTNAGPVCFYVLNRGNSSPYELWKSDGTPEGTGMVFRNGNQTAPFAGSNNLKVVVTRNNEAVIDCRPTRNQSRMQLLRADETFSDILDELGNPAPIRFAEISSSTAAFVVADRYVFGRSVTGGTQFFQLNLESMRLEPFGPVIPGTYRGFIVGDGVAYALTSEATSRNIRMIDPVARTVTVVGPTALDENVTSRTSWATRGRGLLYPGIVPSSQREMMFFDGSGAAPAVVRLRPDTRVINSGPLAAFGTGFIGALGDEAHGSEPAVSDGTTPGTAQIADIDPSLIPPIGGGVATGRGGFCGLQPITPVGSAAVFLGNSDRTACRMWRSDGTPAGTSEMEVSGFTLSTNLGSSPTAFLNLRGGVCMLSSSGLVRLADGASLGSPSTPVVEFAGLAVFGSEQGLQCLDGISAEPVLLSPLAGQVVSSARLPERLVVVTAARAVIGTDGTAAGTVVLSPASEVRSASLSIIPGTARALLQFTEGNATTLITTDGTIAGTQPGSAFVEGSAASSFGQALRAGNSMVFGRQTTSFVPPINLTFWRCSLDGAGAEPLVSFPSATSGRAGPIVRVGDRVLAVLQDIDTRFVRVLATDGTAAGTTLSDLPAPVQGGILRAAAGVSLGSRMLFQYQTDLEGAELWATDGTAAATVPLFAFDPGRRDGRPEGFVVVGSRAYFAAEDAEFGRELWATDGTPGGTVRLTDLAPGVLSANPAALTVIGHTLYFSASDGRLGAEPWKLNLCAADHNADGMLDADDLADFINCVLGLPPCPQADFDSSGEVNGDDLAEYVNAYFAGCE